MEEYKRVLIPVDGSELSKLAVKKGLSLAKLIGARVTAVHVLDKPHYVGELVLPRPEESDFHDFAKKTEAIAADIVDPVKKAGEELGVEVETLVVRGHISDQIIALSRDHDLIVMGTLGQSHLSHLLMGSTAEQVARHAMCPVMLVRENL